MTQPIPYTPREYQKIARRFVLDTPRCNIWMVPGMGKSSVSYSVLDILMLMGSNFFPALIIAPKKVCELTWPAEQRKWLDFAGIKVVKILGDADVREDALFQKGDVYVVNYDNVPWLAEKLRRKMWPFKIVIADEARRLAGFRGEYRVNDHGTRWLQTHGAGGVRSKALAHIAEHVGRWINLTGTPATNGLKDLWGQNWFCDFGERLGNSYGDYMKRWFHEDPYSRVVTLRHPSCEHEIYDKLKDVSLALRAEDWFDIKQPLVMRREVELPPDVRTLYDTMERDFYIQIGEKEINAVNAAVLSSKLLQIASGAVYGAEKTVSYLHDAKIEELKSIVSELGEPLLVAYWFKFEIPMLKKAFPEMRVFTGQADEDAWNRGKIPLMAIHPASGGHGVNLADGGRAIAHYSHGWDLELKIQVNGRNGVVRQMQGGYDRAVLQYEICAKDTIDEVVLARQTTKASIQDALMEARAHRGNA